MSTSVDTTPAAEAAGRRLAGARLPWARTGAASDAVPKAAKPATRGPLALRLTGLAYLSATRVDLVAPHGDVNGFVFTIFGKFC